jgi:endonuclease VIII
MWSASLLACRLPSIAVPEGDTIHRAAVRIRAVLAGLVPQELLTPHPRHRADRWPAKLAGRAVCAVDAHGKHLFLRFEGGLTLHSHLRMTGAWDVHAAGERWRRAERRAWLVLRVPGWEVVEFDGPVLELLPDARTRTDPRLAALGPDVLGEELDELLFLARLRREDPARAIGDALIDQRTLAGIGNYWKSETCFAAAVDPWRAVARVSDREALELVRYARERMLLSAARAWPLAPGRCTAVADSRAHAAASRSAGAGRARATARPSGAHAASARAERADARRR